MAIDFNQDLGAILKDLMGKNKSSTSSSTSPNANASGDLLAKIMPFSYAFILLIIMSSASFAYYKYYYAEKVTENAKKQAEVKRLNDLKVETADLDMAFSNAVKMLKPNGKLVIFTIEYTFLILALSHSMEEFKEYLLAWDRCDHWQREITFSVSAKLPCSGEKWEDAICPEVVREYEQYGTAYLKFVIATEEDLIDAERAVEEFRAGGFTGPVYIMPVGGVERVYSLNNRAVAEMAMRKGWRYSDRLQVPLFKNEWGT